MRTPSQEPTQGGNNQKREIQTDFKQISCISFWRFWQDLGGNSVYLLAKPACVLSSTSIPAVLLPPRVAKRLLKPGENSPKKLALKLEKKIVARGHRIGNTMLFLSLDLGLQSPGPGFLDAPEREKNGIQCLSGPSQVTPSPPRSFQVLPVLPGLLGPRNNTKISKKQWEGRGAGRPGEARENPDDPRMAPKKPC